MCGHKVNSKWILISVTNKPLLCLFFAFVQEVLSAAWVIINGLYGHFIFHWACNGVRISLSDALLAFYHLLWSPPAHLLQLSLPQPQIDAHRDDQNNKKWARTLSWWRLTPAVNSQHGGKFTHLSECLYARMLIDHGFCATDRLMDLFSRLVTWLVSMFILKQYCKGLKSFSLEPYDEFLSFVCVFVSHYFCSVGIWLWTSGEAVRGLIATMTLTLTPGVCFIVLMMWQRKLTVRWRNQNSPKYFVTLNWPGEKKVIKTTKVCW